MPATSPIKTYAQFAELSSIPEQKGVPKAMEMVRLLVKGHEAIPYRRAPAPRAAAVAGTD